MKGPALSSPQHAGNSLNAAWLWIAAAAIVLITAIAYLPAMRGEFIWDDDSYVLNNRAIQRADGLPDIWLKTNVTPQYYPMVFTTFWIEHRLWGLDATGYHIVNVALHMVVALLLWLALRRMGFRDGVAWVAAAVFAVHPVHVESVAWISERKNVLSGVFYLAALLMGVSLFRIGPSSHVTALSKAQAKRLSKQRRHADGPGLGRIAVLFIAMLALFMAALLSKSVTCSLPAVLALLIWWKRGRIAPIEWLTLAPMFAIGVLFALNTVAVERKHVGVDAMALDYSFIERCLIAGRALWFYAGKIIWPHPLIFIYPRWFISSEIWWQYLFPVAAIAVIVALWLLRTRIGRGPLVAALIFSGTLVPALGFVDVFPMIYSFVADHFQYLASISLIVLIVATAATLMKSAPIAQIGLSAIVLCVLAAMGFREGDKYRDQIALWRDTIDKNPHAAMAHTNLGNLLLDSIPPDNRTRDEAASLYRAVVTMGDPALHPIVICRAHYGLGRYWLTQNQAATALQEFQMALELAPNQPMCHYGVGLALETQGRLDEAIECYRRALAMKPNMPLAVDALQRVMRAKAAMTPSP
jgi:hypothetical protein